MASAAETSDHSEWPEELTRTCSEAVLWKSCKQWAAFQRAYHVWQMQLKLLGGSGLGGRLGLVAEQRPAPVEQRTLAGQMVSVLAINALDHGLIIEVCTHVLYQDAEFSKYLECNPQKRAQVTSLRVNTLKTSSEVVCGMAEQGTHAKTLAVMVPSTKVAAVLWQEASRELWQEASRELVQDAARSSPGTVLVMTSGSDNFSYLSRGAHNTENAAVWIARPGMAREAQLPLLSFREKLANPPVPTAPRCPTRAAAALAGCAWASESSGLAREVDGVTLARSGNNATGYLGVFAASLSSGKFRWKVEAKKSEVRSILAQGVCDTAVEAARDRALWVSQNRA